MATVSERDRDHFGMIGRAKYESHRDACERHMALPIDERLLRSLAWTPAELPNWKWSRKGDGPRGLHERARRVGLRLAVAEDLY